MRHKNALTRIIYLIMPRPDLNIHLNWVRSTHALPHERKTSHIKIIGRLKNIFFCCYIEKENENEVFMFKIIFIVSHIIFKRQKRTRHANITDEMEEEDIKVYHLQINMTLESSSVAECYNACVLSQLYFSRERKKAWRVFKARKIKTSRINTWLRMNV